MAVTRKTRQQPAGIERMVTTSRGLKWALAFLCLSTAFGGTSARAEESARAPLLMDGKRTLYQRVLTRPDAEVRSVFSFDVEGIAVRPFSVYYVYDRLTVDEMDWIEIGSDQLGAVDGWIPAENAIDWKQTVVVAFGNSAGRNRLPLFSEKSFVRELLESEDAIARNDLIIAQVTSNSLPPDSPVVSIEPKNYIDFRKQFYLLPILEAEQVYFRDGFDARLLKIASLTKEAGAKPGQQASPEAGAAQEPSKAGAADAASPAPVPSEANRRHRTGVAFVIDATKSMGPYIAEVRAVVGSVLDAVEGAGLGGEVSFSLIGYRDNVESNPELEYVTRLFASFEDGTKRQSFLSAAGHLLAAKESSPQFIEDLYAGVLSAINNLDWDEFGARYIVVITDAGPRLAGDPMSTTGLSTDGIRQLALDRGIGVFALHLLTPEGRRNHDQATSELRSLAAHPKGNLYYAVPAGSQQQLGVAVETVANDLIAQLKLVAEGRDAPEDFEKTAGTSEQADQDLEDLRRNAAQVGYAMRLAYLGRQEETNAPEVFQAWLADRDVTNPSKPALEVRVLLTKNQLSDLHATLKAIKTAGEIGQLSPEGFFDEIRSAAAVMSRVPSRIGRSEFKNLAESGLLGEYLDGLPYRSNAMQISQDLWLSWSVGQQRAFLDNLGAKIRLYEKYHDDVDRWVVLSDTAPTGEAVYPVPMDSLP